MWDTVVLQEMLLLLAHKKVFDFDSMGRAIQGKCIGSVKDTQVSGTVFVTCHWSLFVRCSVYKKPIVKFIHGCNRIPPHKIMALIQML